MLVATSRKRRLPSPLSRRARETPLTFGELVVQTTWSCNARCAMCYQSSGPEGSDTFGKASLSVDELAPVIGRALDIPSLAPRFHLVGGEALIRLQDCLVLLSAARDARFQRISATTNGYWGRRPETARRTCDNLRDAGLTRLEISWDHWHLPFIDGDTVSNCLEACARAGIPTTLRILTTRAHGVEEALRYLRPDALEVAGTVHSATVANTGRAARELDQGDIYRHGDLTENCHRTLSLTINPSGAVFPCCSGFDQTSALAFGNVRERELAEIVARMNRSELLRRVVFEGIGSLVPLIEAAGVELNGMHSSICSLCWTIFSRSDCVAALQASFPNEPFAAC